MLVRTKCPPSSATAPVRSSRRRHGLGEKNAKKVRVARQILRTFFFVVADWGMCRYMRINFFKIFLEERNCRPIFAVSKGYNDWQNKIINN